MSSVLRPFTLLLTRSPYLISLIAAALTLASCTKGPTAVERGNREQVLERGSHADVTDLDPQLAVNIAEVDIAQALFEGLVAEDPQDLHPVPGVAERWEVSPDALTYTFHLRSTAKWSDGTAVTSADFVNSWRRMLTPALGAENAGLLYVLQGAEAFHKGATKDFGQVGVTAPDAHTLRVTLEHPTTYFLSLLTHPSWYPVPLHVISKHGNPTERGNPWTRPGQFVGNGPFTAKTWRPNQEVYAEKSPTYWDAANVKLKGVRFHPIDSVDAEERAFRAGQLHVTYVLPFGKVETYRREAPQLLKSDPYFNSYFLRLNTARAPFTDERVRRALGLAIDRNLLVDRVLKAGQRAAKSLVPPGLASYSPPDVVRYNPQEARQLIAAAGYGADKPLPTIEFLYNTTENHRLIAEALQEMWRRELGINIQLVNQEFKVVLSERRAGHFQILLSDWVGDYLDASTFLDIWKTDSANNHTAWGSVDYDTLLFAAARNSDPKGRETQLQKAETLLINAAPVVPLYYNAHVYLMQPSVKGWYPTILDHHPYKHIWLEP